MSSLPPSDPRHPHYNPDPHAHPGLHAIALVEGSKGALAASSASGLELLGPAPVRQWLHWLVARLHLDPQHGALALFANGVSSGAVHVAAVAVAAYGLLHLQEAWGLWHARAWASWLGCVAASLYLPLDLYAVWRHPGWASAAVLAINLLIVWALARDILRRRY